MKLRNKLFRIMVTLLLTLAIILPDASPLILGMAQAAQTEYGPAPTTFEKTLYTGYYDFTIEFNNLEKGSPVTYSSSNKAVATVSTKGVVKPVAAGKANISVTIKQNGNSYAYQIKITVKKPSIKITSSKGQLEVGYYFTFSAKAYGIKNPSLSWYSSNEAIAAIGKKSGLLNPIKAGTVTITVKDDKSGIKKEMKVKVSAKKTSVTPTPTPSLQKNSYTPPEGSDKAKYISGLDLSKKNGDFYTTTKEEYIETTRFILYLDEGVEVPVNVIYLINHIMDLVEEKTGYTFYCESFKGSNDFTMDYEIGKYFDTGEALKKVNAKHDRLSIVVAKQNSGAYASGSDGVMLWPEDINLLDGNEYVLVHELCHVAFMRDGCWMGQTLGEGFSTYYSTLITKEDKVLNGYYDGYDQLKGMDLKLTEDNMESTFIEMTVGTETYQLGFRMMNYIMETYGADAFRKMHAKMSKKYDTATQDVAAAYIKSELSKNFFKEFVRWYQKHYLDFGDKDMSDVGDWVIASGELRKYYGSDAEVVIPDTVTSIQESAFRDDKSMTSVKIPDSVTTIGACAFYDCDGLTEIVIPDSVTMIYSSAFSECNKLSKVILPKGLTRIAVNLFVGCTSLKQIKIPEGVTSIEGCAFSQCSALTTVKLPSTLESIGESAFILCSSLKSITIPDSVTSIGDNAFAYCSTSLTIYGKSGSYAETYAKKNKIKFSVIE